MGRTRLLLLADRGLNEWPDGFPSWGGVAWIGDDSFDGVTFLWILAYLPFRTEMVLGFDYSCTSLFERRMV